MSDAIPTQATHHIDQVALEAWLGEHSLTPKDVREASIGIGWVRGSAQIGAWLDVTWYKRNEAGNLYVDPDNRDEAATGHSTIPLASFPPLTATEPRAGGDAG